MSDVEFSFQNARPWNSFCEIESVVELGRRIMDGSIRADNKEAPYPMGCFGPLEEIQPGLAFMPFFGNITILETTEGLVLIDGGGLGTGFVHQQIRKWNPNAPLHTGIYTHGHIDHVQGIRALEKIENTKMNVIAHKNTARRFDRYSLTRKLNAAINYRQFQGSVGWPSSYRYPDVEYDDEMKLTIGDEEIHLFHSRGETDDGTWVWLPKRKVICSGDLFIWTFPNCGNPQKTQRYCVEWAAALRQMASLKPELLLPGHGPPIPGYDLIQEALLTTAEALESIFNQTISAMNSGLRLQEVVDKVKLSPELLKKPYLNPQYDQIDFIVRNIWRLYGGWWDGNPSHLEPVSNTVLSSEIIRLSGGVQPVMDRVNVLLTNPTTENIAVACHLMEYVISIDTSDKVKDLYKKIYSQRAKQAKSTMATGIYTYTSNQVTSKNDDFLKKIAKL